MEDALNRILTPKRSVDILRDVETAKEQRRPYVIVFVGVNGVGKSTNLAKVGICRVIASRRGRAAKSRAVWLGCVKVYVLRPPGSDPFWLFKPVGPSRESGPCPSLS